VNGEFPVCESQSQTAIEIPQQQAEDMPFLRRQDTDWLQGFRPAGEIHSRRRQDSGEIHSRRRQDSVAT